MVVWHLLAYSIFRTIGKSVIFSSQWCSLQAFVQAVMWHSTEPRTLGVSYWATGLFIGTACLPGLLYLLLSAAIPTKKPRNTPCRITSLFIANIPSMILLCASLPSLNERASIRTILLAIGVLFSYVYIVIISLKHSDISNAGSIKRNQKAKPTSAHPRTFKARRFLLESFTSSGTGSGAVLAVFLTMSVRWYFWGVNVFYEDWRWPLVMTVIVLIYAATSLIWEQSAVRNPKSVLPTLAKWKLSNCDKNHATGCNNEEPTEKAGGRDKGLSTRGNERVFSNEQQETDAIERGNGAGTQENGIIDGVNRLVSPITPREENNVFSSCTGSDINTRRQGSKTTQLSAFLYAATLGPALGALSYIFLWIFSSPCILRLWGGTPGFRSEYLLFTCFAVGCLLALITNLEKICSIQYSDPNANEIKISRVKRLLVWQCLVNALLIVSTTLGASLTLVTKGVPCLFGAGVLCLTSPLLLRSLVVMSCDLVATAKSLQTVGKRTAINTLPGVLFFLSGVTFVVFHLLGVMFVNPQLTSVVHGKMGAVLVPQILLVVLPLIVGPMVKNRIKKRNEIRSPSMGPLLGPPETKREDKIGEKKCNKIFPAFEIWRIRKYRKISQIVFILIVAFSASLCKYSSQRQKLKCNSELRVIENCQESSIGSTPEVRVISWNILLGHDMNGRNNLDDIAKAVDEYEPDILGLQEATVHPPFWGGKDVFGYLQSNTRSCSELGEVMDPRSGSFEVGMLSRFKILSTSSKVLPGGGEDKLPKYTMAKITCEVAPICNLVGELGSGLPINRTQTRYKLHVYTLHAVYKNWTCETYSQLSCEQMQFVHDDVRQLPKDEPVIVMGDFNTNPSEPELDIWFQSDLGFKSAMWQKERNSSRSHFNHTCGENPIWDDEECNCECRRNSSDPPATTILNRRAAVDHIFYRGLRLLNSTILDQVGEVSDHYPVFARFAFE